MLNPPDPLRQRCIDLSAVIAAGDALFLTFERYGSGFDGRYPDQMRPLEDRFNVWYATALAVLSAEERFVFEQIRAEATAPTWEETWDVATGRSEHTWRDERGSKEDLFNRRIMRYFERMLDYLKALRLYLFPPSPVSDDLRVLFAESFRNRTNSIIDDLFISNGCLIGWWVTPRKPTAAKSVNRALGWIDGLMLHTPDDLVTRLQAVYQSFQRHKQVPLDALRDDMQVALAAVLQPASGTSLAAHHFHPTIEQTAERLWAIGDYDTALFKVCIALNSAVQARSQRPDLDGVALMRTVFSAKTPILNIEARYGNQQGFMDLFAGVMDAIRNPRAHHQQAQLTREEALEWLAFLSALFRVLDASTP